MLFVGNLPRGVSKESLRELFEHVGPIEELIFSDLSFWAHLVFRKKESALLAIRYFNGQVCMHGSRIPIDVRFKERRYNHYMTKKAEQDHSDPFNYAADKMYHKIYN